MRSIKINPYRPERFHLSQSVRQCDSYITQAGLEIRYESPHQGLLGDNRGALLSRQLRGTPTEYPMAYGELGYNTTIYHTCTAGLSFDLITDSLPLCDEIKDNGFVTRWLRRQQEF